MKNWNFYRLLHGRNDEKTGRKMTVAVLAERIGSNRAHLCEVLANKPGHGFRTRRRLFPHLTSEEVRTLGWVEEYDRWRFLEERKMEVACLADCSTKNNVTNDSVTNRPEGTDGEGGHA